MVVRPTGRGCNEWSFSLHGRKLAEPAQIEKVELAPMVAGKTAHLQSEINRLAAKLNAAPVEVGVILKDDDVNIFIDDDGGYHYSYWERGRANYDRVGEIDDVLYWFAEGITFEIGCSYSAKHSPQDQDFRILLWARQYELLNELDPRWARRCVRERAEKFRAWGNDEDVKLLPNIPERNSSPHPDSRRTGKSL
jgi:hypothetical protein